MDVRDPSRPARGRPLVVSLTKYLPWASIPHAGGQYLYRHYRALSIDFDVLAVAPATASNAFAAHTGASEFKSWLVGSQRVGDSNVHKLLRDVDSVVHGSIAPRSLERALRRDPALISQLARADLIELQWSETASLAPVLRALFPGKPLVAIAHDVITERWERASKSARSPLTRTAYRAAAHRSRRREEQSFSSVDRLIVFSDKDRAKARELAPTAHIDVVAPGLGPISDSASWTDDASKSPRTGATHAKSVLFVGAMNRPDNSRAMEQFIDNVWPLVQVDYPLSVLIVAGASPPRALVKRARRQPSIMVTGAIESLEPLYRSASVVVVPVISGAGVKFKTIEGMLHAVPVVTTTIGAAGIGRPDLLAAITDDSRQFADAVVSNLRMPDARTKSAFDWAVSTFGFDRYSAELIGIYRTLIPT